jgi:hypothetical protein
MLHYRYMVKNKLKNKIYFKFECFFTLNKNFFINLKNNKDIKKKFFFSFGIHFPPIKIN